MKGKYNLSNEEWIDINGYEDLYQVSTIGNIRSKDLAFEVKTKSGSKCIRFKKSKLMKPSLSLGGYKQVILTKKGMVKQTIRKDRTGIRRGIKKIPIMIVTIIRFLLKD
ncbi:NUMOD4 domain-containing protein [Elizabethkingia anophelis]|uniref:NUMOD4 domain-containing protein n=1 Tax=Elizabethkingia anophelis TaxID=1117645 RepID=UPI0023E95201|nr:NUMOD4 domain-containing protein [Elizabethkingia anophelis]GJN60463.1 hypothetical protein ELAK_06130 [Elizabethkingia anophelis]HDP3254009.1 hypothetical protein [Elizabethkingia anophelis]